jgi:small-conductance mechanosensitive channel
VTGQHRGTVEKIGIKTTRIRALQGEEIIISNQELTNSRINNYKRMEQRRITVEYGVTYDTSKEKMKKALEVIKKIVDDEEMTEFDRVYFTSYGDFALKIELVYYIKSEVYEEYLKAQQAMNFKIMDEFENLGIEMAFPTQTIHLNKS